MNILFLTQVLPYPLDAGPKVRAYFNLRYLVGKHAVTLLSFIRSTDSPEALFHLNRLCKQVITVPMLRSKIRDGLAFGKSILFNQPFLISRDHFRELNLSLRKIIQQNHFDVIHADQLWMAPYGLKAREEALRCGYNPRLILDQHNAVFLIPKRMADSSSSLFLRKWLMRESVVLSQYERSVCEQYDRVVWVTKEDQMAVSSAEPKAGRMDHHLIDRDLQTQEKNSVIPICIDPRTENPNKELSETPFILFIGGMHWPPNADAVTWFANDILPLVLKSNSRAQFWAVGKKPPIGLKDFKENVFSPGYVENTDDYWKRSRVFVVPLRAGGGMRVKILDAWAKGIPIVSTTIGAEGIRYHPGKDIIIADTPQEFAQAVQQILTDKELAQRLSLAGRTTVENCYDWEKIYPAWDEIYS